MKLIPLIALFAFGTANAALPAGAKLTSNVSYGSDPLQKMDVYSPKGAKNDPVILMVHGGGWERGDKTANDVVTNKVAYYLPKGYVFISTNYRLFPQVNPPSEAIDVATATSFVRQNAAKWGGDASRVVLMGHSAGANLVTLAQSSAAARNVIGVVALDSGAYNIPEVMSRADYPPQYNDIFGHNVALETASSPTLQLSGKPVPMLLICDSQRKNDCGDASAYAAEAESYGAVMQVYPVDARHGDINLDVGLNNAETKQIQTFLCGLKAGC